MLNSTESIGPTLINPYLANQASCVNVLKNAKGKVLFANYEKGTITVATLFQRVCEFVKSIFNKSYQMKTSADYVADEAAFASEGLDNHEIHALCYGENSFLNNQGSKTAARRSMESTLVMSELPIMVDDLPPTPEEAEAVIAQVAAEEAAAEAASNNRTKSVVKILGVAAAVAVAACVLVEIGPSALAAGVLSFGSRLLNPSTALPPSGPVCTIPVGANNSFVMNVVNCS